MRPTFYLASVRFFINWCSYIGFIKNDKITSKFEMAEVFAVNIHSFFIPVESAGDPFQAGCKEHGGASVFLSDTFSELEWTGNIVDSDVGNGIIHLFKYFYID